MLIVFPNFIIVIPDCEGQVAIVTGGNKGIGYETVKGLCKAHMTVIMGKQIVGFNMIQAVFLFINQCLSKRFHKNITTSFLT